MSGITHNHVLRIFVPFTFLVPTYITYGPTGAITKVLCLFVWWCIETRRSVVTSGDRDRALGARVLGAELRVC